VETYDRDVPEVFSIQQDIAGRVSRSLALTLFGDEPNSLRFRAQTTIPEAYEAFLLGLFHWNKATEQGARKSIEHFTEAIGLDPSYAPAYARLAFAHTFLASGNFASDRETYPKAIDAAQKALDIDTALADAYSARGFVRWRFDWNWSEARKDIERGLDLNPNSPLAHNVFGLFLYSIGDFDDAIAEMKNGLDLDPLNPLARWNLGRILFAAGQGAAAEREFRRALEIEPFFSWPHIGLAWGLIEQGQHEKAVEELQRASRLSEGSAFIAEHLGYTYALSGKRAEAEAIARSLSETQTHDASAYKLAALHAALGNKNEALTWLARAVSARDDELVYLKVDRRFESLRAYPEFRDVIRSVAIPD
jgi:tetratricopeptide (TPR) repeat protein